ncbi:MAG TPA: hypothetical protein VH682_06385, partial [Gemmataceae bacterium]
PAGAERRDGDFSLQAEVIEALEGGPVVLRLTLSYDGKNPVVLLDPPPRKWDFPIALLCHPKGYDVSTPKGWRRHDGDFRIWPARGIYVRKQALIPPGWKYSERLYVHGWFRHIPSGRTSLKVSTVMEVEGKPEKEVSTVVDINVQAATPERVTALRRRLERSPDLPPLDFGEELPENWIYGTRHSALVPFALRRIEVFLTDQMLDFCYYLSDAPEEVHAHMVALACKSGWTGRVALFAYWRDRGFDEPKVADERPGFPDWFDYQYWPTHRTPLPPQEFSKLLKAKNPWTRILTYLTFPARCPRDWTRALLEDCRQLTRPLPADQFAQLLHDLDADSFAVREKASERLEQLGERVETHLKQASQTPLSPEAKRRVRSALEKIAATPRSPDCDQVIRYLIETTRTPETDAILTALAEGDPDIRLTQYVKTALQERQKPPSDR